VTFDVVDREAMLARPLDVVAHIEEKLPLTNAKVVRSDRSMSLLELAFTATLELEAHGFPIEVVRLAQFSDGRHPDPYAFPVGPTRTWYHRYPLAPENGCLGQLCLWYPLDPPHLKWRWADGVLSLVSIVRRHLWFEEQFRRTGLWPVEDAPHSHTADGVAHAIRTPALQSGRR
jgi:hypothetical protein